MKGTNTHTCIVLIDASLGRIQNILLNKTMLTFHDGTDALPDGETTAAVVLTDGQLQVEQGQATEEEHDAVGNEEGACTEGDNCTTIKLI